MQLFYAPNLSDVSFQLNEEESKHCLKVLRKKIGDQIHVTNGKGSLALCKISGIDSKKCNLDVIDWLDQNKAFDIDISLAVAFPKNKNRIEWLIEKAVELSVQKIIPLRSLHSELKRFNRDRAEKVALSAMKQSLHLYLPIIENEISVKNFIGSVNEDRTYLLADVQSKVALNKLDLATNKFVVLIGPEGDFSDEEKQRLVKNGCQSFHLGQHRLRTETAAIAALSSLNALLQE